MPRNIFAVFRAPDEVISHMSVEMFSLFIRFFTLLPSYAQLYVLNNDLLVMVMMMMIMMTMTTMMLMMLMLMLMMMMMMMMMMMRMRMISLISYFPFRDQLSLDLSK